MKLELHASVTLSKRWRWALILYVLHSIASVPLPNGTGSVGHAAITEAPDRLKGSGSA